MQRAAMFAGELVHAIERVEADCRDAEAVMEIEKGVMYSRIRIVGCGVTERSTTIVNVQGN